MINLKSKIIVMKNIKLKVMLFISIIFFVVSIINGNNAGEIQAKEEENIYKAQEIKKEEVKEVVSVKTKEAYINMPKDIKGYTVIGKIEIPKIELSTYILDQTTKESLNESVTKLCGPKINGLGNVCIIGHNYKSENMFKKLKNLEMGDKIVITDVYDQSIEYIVYDIYKVYPKETKCLSQETNGEREVTLITCATGAIKRLIVKARELYD